MALCPALCLAATPAHIDRLRMQADAGRDPQALSTLHQIAHNGPPDAQRALGEVLLRLPGGERANEALKGLAWLERAAAQEDQAALLLLGKTWFLGAPGVNADARKARAWLEKVNTEKLPQAAYYLGLIEKKSNPAQALTHFTTAANGGVAEAMYQLGNSYAHGEGVDHDPRAAMRWYLKAAALEHPQALQELAQAFTRGDTLLPQSELQADNMRRAVEHALRHPKAAP